MYFFFGGDVLVVAVYIEYTGDPKKVPIYDYKVR